MPVRRAYVPDTFMAGKLTTYAHVGVIWMPRNVTRVLAKL